jgi:hypothetical protein
MTVLSSAAAAVVVAVVEALWVSCMICAALGCASLMSAASSLRCVLLLLLLVQVYRSKVAVLSWQLLLPALNTWPAVGSSNSDTVSRLMRRSHGCGD